VSATLLPLGDFERPEEEYAPFAALPRPFQTVQDAPAVPSLFAVRDHFDYAALGGVLDEIEGCLPALRRIFSRPITRLRDSYEIKEVEAVRVIEHRAITHAASHSELWNNLTPSGIHPRRLMSTEHEEDYLLHENQAVVYAVLLILRLIRRNRRLLNQTLSAGSDRRINLLDREEHPSYVLALGQLRLGYVRDSKLSREPAEICLARLDEIENALRPRLQTPLYRACYRSVERCEGFDCKRTAVFRSNKDYAAVYRLLRRLAREGVGSPPVNPPTVPGPGYCRFLGCLAAFAAEHFGFAALPERRGDPQPCFRAENGPFSLEMTEETGDEGSRVMLCVTKERSYRIALLPLIDRRMSAERLEAMMDAADADEALICDPYEEERGRLYLSRYDLDSFRRLQQLLLRAMICADEKRDICPFCLGPLRNLAVGNDDCPACRTQITRHICSVTARPYVSSRIRGYEPEPVVVARGTKDDPLEQNGRIEGMLHYRNITPVDRFGRPLCPHCHRLHGVEDPM